MYVFLNMLLEFGNKNNNNMPSYVPAMKEAGGGEVDECFHQLERNFSITYIHFSCRDFCALFDPSNAGAISCSYWNVWFIGSRLIICSFI